MEKTFDPRTNYENSRREIGFVSRKQATQDDYNRIGFMSGLEVHQQLLTSKKLFCNCPAGLFNKSFDYDAEVIRHMRPTLSELGEYDGTALMEFKTRKEIIYRVKNQTTCTYEVDDTPPFPINREALQIAIEISLLSKLNIVGEVHITRKQYLDGSIPAGFQRTAIIGVEGMIPLKNKNVRLIQLSIEEDSCREISDIGHTRIYKTDRLGMPLIETVTYPEMVNPDEVMEACNYIRFLNRSTGKVRTGIGAGRQDVNVSCRGGHRVEIKGVAHTKWIPELTHIECFRQWALLAIRDKLKAKVSNPTNWSMIVKKMDLNSFDYSSQVLKNARSEGLSLYALNLPKFMGILSHFTQPGQMFANEFIERLKVIACIEKPNMWHSEQFENEISESDLHHIRKIVEAGNDDAIIIIRGQEADMNTAIDTIEERCRMAFEGVPPETRKSFADGTTIFERVLPGADRMYPDTDSAPIPLANSYIEELNQNLPLEVVHRYEQLQKWGVAASTFNYLLSRNLFDIIQQIHNELNIDAKYIGNFLGHRLKWIEGHMQKGDGFTYSKVIELFKFLKRNNIEYQLAFRMLKVVYSYPKMDFDSVLTSINYKKRDSEELVGQIGFLNDKFIPSKSSEVSQCKINWIMGSLYLMAEGNINLTKLQSIVKQQIQ